jgi:hypothetical protein
MLFKLLLRISYIIMSHGGSRENAGRKTDASKRAASEVVGESPFTIASERAAKKHKQDQLNATSMGGQVCDPMTPEDDWSCGVCTFNHGGALSYLSACSVCGAEKGTVDLPAAADDDTVPAPPAAGGGGGDDDENNGTSTTAPATAAADDEDVPMFEAIAEHQGDRATTEAQSTGATAASAVDHVAAAVALQGEAGVLTLAGLFSTMIRVFFTGIFSWFERICANERRLFRNEFAEQHARLLASGELIDEKGRHLADKLKLTQNNTTLRDFSQHEQFICQNGRGDLFCSICSDQAHLVADGRVTSSAWIKGSVLFSRSPISIYNDRNSLRNSARPSLIFFVNFLPCL